MRSLPPFLAAAILLTAVPALAQIPNTLTPQEKAQGWHLLFDGRTTSGWHSTHGPDFPATGWDVKDGLLSVTEHGGEEGGNAGDILSTRKYANFELSVDFRITPGANFGIKYFVDPAFTPGHGGHVPTSASSTRSWTTPSTPTPKKAAMATALWPPSTT
jgi:hypothetical protein